MNTGVQEAGMSEVVANAKPQLISGSWNTEPLSRSLYGKTTDCVTSGYRQLPMQHLFSDSRQSDLGFFVLKYVNAVLLFFSFFFTI